MEPILTDTLSEISDKNPRNTIGELISMDEAVAWTKTYQDNHQEGQLKAIYFSANVFQALLKQTGAAGIRIYNATNVEGKDCFVLVGATADSDLTERQNIVYDKGHRCPDGCVASILNHG